MHKDKIHSRQHSCKLLGSTAQADAGMPEKEMRYDGRAGGSCSVGQCVQVGSNEVPFHVGSLRAAGPSLQACILNLVPA